jgi:hypothetical protein
MWMSVVKLFFGKKPFWKKIWQKRFFIEIRLKIWVILKSTTALALGAQVTFWPGGGGVGGTPSKIYPQFSRQVNHNKKHIYTQYPYYTSILILTTPPPPPQQQVGLKDNVYVKPGNTKWGSITLPLTSCMTGLELGVCQLLTIFFAKQTNPNQSNRRSTARWYFPL